MNITPTLAGQLATASRWMRDTSTNTHSFTLLIGNVVLEVYVCKRGFNWVARVNLVGVGMVGAFVGSLTGATHECRTEAAGRALSDVDLLMCSELRSHGSNDLFH